MFCLKSFLFLYSCSFRDAFLIVFLTTFSIIEMRKKWNRIKFTNSKLIALHGIEFHFVLLVVFVVVVFASGCRLRQPLCKRRRPWCDTIITGIEF